MRVLLVCHGYPPFGVAGVERQSALTAEALAGRGHTVTVLTRRPGVAPPTLKMEDELRGDLRIVTIAGGGADHERFPGNERALERAFERVLLEADADVVLVGHLRHHSPGYVAVAHRWRTPIVLELHDFFSLCPRAHLERRSGELCDGPEGGAACATHCFAEQPDAELRWALRLQSFKEAVRSADAVLAPSRFVADAFESVRGGGSAIGTIENAVRPIGPVLRRQRGAGAPLGLASIGVTVRHKGFQVVIEALRRAELGAARYTILGVAPQPGARKLQEAADRVPGLELRLFGGFSPEHLPSLLGDVDALVVPSLVAETYSIVAREAFACGVPVIASRIGALTEAIRPDENGWTFPPGDSSALAALLRRLDEDRSLLQRAARGASATETTSVTSRTDRIEALLESVARGGAARAQGEELRRMRDAVARPG